MRRRNTPPIDPETRIELAEWLDNESANTSDAEFGMKLASLAEEQYMSVERNAAWFGETGFPSDHPSQRIADISSAFDEATSDALILLDGLWSKDLTLVNEEWRESMAVQLDQEAARIAVLLGNASQIVRELCIEEATQ
jgi:hypothetical protein